MRKLAVFSVLALALMATGVTPAHAAGPFCVHLTNFCDTLTVTSSGTNNYGTWDWTCDGVNLTSVIGINSAGLITDGTRPVASGAPFAYSTNFTFNKASHTFDLWGTEGTLIFPFQLGQPFSITAGACSGSGPKTGKPSIKGLQ